MACLWNGVSPMPADPILGVKEAYKRDTSDKKINLSVGAYRDDQGQPWVLPSVRIAERAIAADESLNKEYQPVQGHAAFCERSAAFALSPESPAIKENRVCAVQTLSGTGSLRVAAETLTRVFGVNAVWIPNPTWGNHKKIFGHAGMKVNSYTYLDEATGTTLDFDGMVADIKANCPDGSVVLLHSCAHNPTGIDPTNQQWDEIAAVFLQKQLTPIFDTAYQGFASGDPDVDAYSIRSFERKGIFPIVCQSFAKNMGLYGERVGVTLFVCESTQQRDALMTQVKGNVVRPMYSSPPLHGARIASMILGDEALNKSWRDDLRKMSERVRSMRGALRSALLKHGVPCPSFKGEDAWRHVTDQIGMFTYTGMKPHHVDAMRERFHIYMTSNGRISMAGLKPTNVDYMATAMKVVLQDPAN